MKTEPAFPQLSMEHGPFHAAVHIIIIATFLTT